MAGLVPAIHVFLADLQQRCGCPALQKSLCGLREKDCLARHDEVKRSLVRDTIPKSECLPMPPGCSLGDLQAEAEKALRELSAVTAKIAVELFKGDRREIRGEIPGLLMKF